MISRTRQTARMLERFETLKPEAWEPTLRLGRDLRQHAAEYDRKHGSGAWARSVKEDWELS